VGRGQKIGISGIRRHQHCFALAAASEWCRMERREAQRCSSRLQRESDYMQASVLRPLSVVVVHGGSLVRGNCTISPRLTRGRRMSGDGRE